MILVNVLKESVIIREDKIAMIAIKPSHRRVLHYVVGLYDVEEYHFWKEQLCSTCIVVFDA